MFDIKEKVKLQSFVTLSEAITYAKSVKELIETNSKKTTRRSPWDSLNSRRSVAANGDTPHPQSEKDQEKEKTFDLNGTKAETASKKQVENPHQWPNLSKCFRCGKQGTSPILVLNKEL